MYLEGKALKTYQSVFKDVYFCPTGGLNNSNFDEYLNLNNVISVGQLDIK